MMSLKEELQLARSEIRQGRFERSMALMAAFAAIVSGWEAYAQHLRGAFSHWLMWTPVGLTPPTVAVALAALFNERIARRVLPAVALISVADGVIGFVFHLRGISRMPGGWRVGQYNIVMGPPVFAPLLTCTVGVISLLAALLRREDLPRPTWDERLRSLLGEFLLNLLPPTSLSLERRARRRGVRVESRSGFAANVARGRFQRTMALVSAIFAVLAGGEAYFEHLRGSFNQRVMWTPVWVTPPMVAAAVGAIFSQRVAEHVLPITSTVTFLDGLLGFGLHVQGIQRMPGGLRNLQFNFTMGPPLFAPLLMSSVGLLGFIASLVRRASRSPFK
jgi:hypothetical protein